MKELEPKQQRFDFEFREVSNNARESVPEETPEEKRVAKFNEILGDNETVEGKCFGSTCIVRGGLINDKFQILLYDIDAVTIYLITKEGSLESKHGEWLEEQTPEERRYEPRSGRATMFPYDVDEVLEGFTKGQ